METIDLKCASQMLPAALDKDIIRTPISELCKAEWVNVKDELPTERGIYHILTDEHLMEGYAFFGLDEDTGEMCFDVMDAWCGKDPHVMYWLKDHKYGLLYEFKKEKGEI